MQKNPRLSIKNLLNVDREIKLKILHLGVTFLLMSACLVIWKPLKMAVFSKMVGASFIPIAKLYSLSFVIPLILFYSKLVDWLRRHHLLYWFTLFHGTCGIVFYYLLSHPVYGLANTHVSTDRWVGWSFYFFMESFDAFFATAFWAFADSINKPKDAKLYYGYIVSGSKIGGILSAGILYLVLKISTAGMHTQLLSNGLLLGSFFLFAAAFTIYLLVKNVSDDYMHGYEAAYKLETTKEKHKKSIWQSTKGSVDGLFIMIKNPYVLGIFSLVSFYEIMIVIFDYWVVLSADAQMKTVGAMTAYYALYYLLMNIIGLIICLFGTTPILRVLGIRMSLFVFPAMLLIMLITSFLFPTANIFFIVLVGMRSFNYALNHPTREILYIPTTKDIKFKAKTWTDAFGSRIAKSFGSIFNVSLKGFSPAFALASSIGLLFSLTGFWFIIVYFLGKTLQDAIDNKKVIGEKNNEVA